jgi:cellulose synthase/poly-beta-1,6-N-acetylglucosamine synthase-like glycosyltransferase
MLLFWIIIPIFTLYSILIIYYWRSWRSIPVFSSSQTSPSVKISVIIPARNEEDNIGPLLIALDQQSYPKHLFEIIVIDDHSEDRTAEIVRQYPWVKLLTLEDTEINSYKKKAIEAGIAGATGELVVTTDADCQPGKRWLETIAAFKEETKAVFIAAPVVIHCNSSFVQLFQAMDFMVLQGITGAVVYKNNLCMCNGANLAYEKKVFAEVNGFAGVDHIASGDDMLLMHKIWKLYPDKVVYLKASDGTMSTQPVKSWKDFYAQRIRWASKARQYDDKRILPVLVLVYLLNLCFVVLLIAGFGIMITGWEQFCSGCQTLVETLFGQSHLFNEQGWQEIFFSTAAYLYIVLSGF